MFKIKKKGREIDFNKAYGAHSNGKILNNSNSPNNNSSLYRSDIDNKFNWGAFFLSWIWGFCHKSYITLVIFPALLLSFIPILGIIVPLGLCVWFGICGNKWAWEKGDYTSIASFHEIQKKWAIAGLIVFILSILISVLRRLCSIVST